MTSVLERAADALAEKASPPYLKKIRDWRDSSCLDPQRHPSQEIAPNWEGPGTLCRSCATCRPEQRIPAGDWDTWLYLAGRGAGKTRSAAEVVAEALVMHRRWRIAVLAPTYADARDTCIEGESGLISIFDRWGWREGREYVWNRSLGELMVRATRSRVKLYSAEKPARLRGPQHHCFPAGTPVRVPGGSVPIETLKPGDVVLTRFGAGTVEDARSRYAELVEVHHQLGTLRCTPDHLLWVEGSGWVEARLVNPGDRVAVWQEETGRSTSAAITTDTRRAERNTGTGSCGRSTTGPFPGERTSTISTTTQETTISETLPFSPARSTCATTTKKESDGLRVPRYAETASSPTRPGAMEESTPSGAPAVDQKWQSGPGCWSPGRAKSAEQGSAPETGTSVVSGVSISAGATVFNIQVGPDPEYFAGDVVVHNCAWVDELAQVVKDAPDAWDMLLFGLRLGRHPRVICTTTPLPVQVIKDLLTDETCTVTRGTTDDNAANLAPVTLRKLHRKYDGTRLGRQELGAEMLDDIPGALWRRAWLDDGRIPTDLTARWHEWGPERTGPVAAAILAELELHGISLHRIVVAVDPAVTSGDDDADPGAVGKKKGKARSDESGIVVAGRADDGHFYVLADYTVRDTPDAVMAKVIQAVDDWGANAVVVETNNGGDYIPGMLRMSCRLTGHPVISIEKIHAKKSKRVRAEPVSAIYGQGQAHHVGTHHHLEDQICIWTPDAVESPDRMDAMVYAILHLDVLGLGSEVMAPSGARGRLARHQMRRHTPTGARRYR